MAGNVDKKLPSVTRVLGKYQDWSKIPPAVLDAACRRGTAVHSYCSCYARGLFCPKPLGAEGYCVSFERWFNTIVKDVYMVEKRLVDAVLGFTGRPDLVCLLAGDDDGSVVDIKTPVALHPIWASQLAAYLHLVTKSGNLLFPIKQAGSLRLDPDGGQAKMKWYSDHAADFMAFQNALVAHKWYA